MFSLFRLHFNSKGDIVHLDQVIRVYSWKQMIYVVEQHFGLIQPFNDKWLTSLENFDVRDYEVAFKDQNDDVYVIYRTSSWWDDDRYYDDYYNGYYDGYDDKGSERHLAQQIREMEKWERIFRNPDLLIKKYCPQPKLIEASRENEWHVGALHD